MVTLSDTNESGCTNILIMEDELLEGQEHFYVSFQVYDYFGSYTLEGSDSARITIVDSNGKYQILYCPCYMSFFMIFATNFTITCPISL